MEIVDRRQLMFIHDRTPVECQYIDQLLLRPVAAQNRSKGRWRLVFIDFISMPVIDWFWLLQCRRPLFTVKDTLKFTFI